MPMYEGQNIIVDLDEEDYTSFIEDLKYSIVGRIFLPKGNSFYEGIESKVRRRLGTRKH